MQVVDIRGGCCGNSTRSLRRAMPDMKAFAVTACPGGKEAGHCVYPNSRAIPSRALNSALKTDRAKRLMTPSPLAPVVQEYALSNDAAAAGDFAPQVIRVRAQIPRTGRGRPRHATGCVDQMEPLPPREVHASMQLAPHPQEGPRGPP